MNYFSLKKAWLNHAYLEPLISTTSSAEVPHMHASRFPSCDQTKLNISLSLKFVNCFGGPPANGWLQTLSRVFMYVRERPSGRYRTGGVVMKK